MDIARQARRGASTDDLFEVIHKAVPGFAGLLYEHGVPTVYLVDTRLADLAQAALTPLLIERQRQDRGFHVREARYSWLELLEWRLTARALFDDESVSSLGVSVRENLVVIGVRDDTDTSGLLARITELGVNPEGVMFRRAEPVPTASSLSDRHRPVMGGLEIDSGSDECTAGFNVDWQDSIRAVMTAAHCMPPIGSMGGAIVRQPSPVPNNRIGVEFVDPGFYTCVPQGETDPTNQCRKSDAALILSDDSVNSSFGHIARTTSRGQWTGSTTIDPARSRLWIVDSYQTMAVGDTVDKIGRTTGWTTGPVVETCVDRLSGGKWFICQTTVAAGGKPGDSGSPAFEMGVAGQVRLVGIVWGAYQDSLFFYSPMIGIEYDFGEYISVIGDAPTLPSGPSISGPTDIRPGATCSWQGSVTGGTNPITWGWTNDGQPVSSTSSYTGGKDPGSQLSTFSLKLTVTNDAGSNDVTILVTEDAGADVCVI